ncbi:MAG: hypothetical protein ACD_80C00006G0011 [uncultured bacterium (gcode 4)]|uniref:EfeO-type cupredoxin-like domain-containing protein n=1 Tax=uncultured bacterium (gcode 4) TaxID=1234023 RepID=K1YK62_9BACT|nr:MAG: hypothetical protein ACD_80C00006G0011 [uncultured bacterium (gcode 4)]
MNKKLFIPVAMLSIAVVLSTLTGCGKIDSEKNGTIITGNQNTNVQAKEFVMTSFTEIIDGKYFPQYSIKEITVKKWDLVRIKVTVTKGMHDLNIDEFNVHSETPLDEETVIEFTADKAGTFIYYCSKPGHRENGHWGTLTVTE